MTYSNIDSLNLGNVLQIIFSNGVRNQLSQDFRDFSKVKSMRVGNSLARELRYMLQTSYGPGAIQYRNPGTSGRAFPTAQQSTVQECTAKFKELNATIELEYNLWDRARKSPEKYAEPLALEIDSKSSASKRRIAADFYLDGTGVIGQVSSTACTVTSPASDKLVFSIDQGDTARGTVGHFEFGDILVLKSAAGSTSALDTSLGTEPAYWKVYEKSREDNTVTLQGLDSNLAPVATITAVSTPAAAGEVFYRYGQPTIPDLTASISDYGTLTEVMAGLESLAAADGRVCHSITMSGATAGSQYDCDGAAIDVRHIQRTLDKAKNNVGQDRYKYKLMSMAMETQAAFIESRETDRRFQSITDTKRGVSMFAYVHGSDTVECYTSEYCPQKRIWFLPETKGGERVLEFHGSDFEPVRAQGGNEFQLKPASSGGGFVNTMVSYLQAVGVIVAKHPAAIGCSRNFTNA